MKTLKPQILLDKDLKSLERQVLSAIYEIVFSPVIHLLRERNAQIKQLESELIKELHNANPNIIVSALKSGRIQYKDGVFSGNFNRAISSSLRSIGAKFDKKIGIYKISPAQISDDIRSASALYELEARKLHSDIGVKLAEIQKNLEITIGDYNFKVNDTLNTVVDGFKVTVADLSVMPEISEMSYHDLRMRYTNNLKLSVKNFSDTMIREMREDVEANAMRGYRFSSLQSKFTERFLQSESKAKFLARTETSIFMSEFRKAQFTEMGIGRFIWRTSGDARVRDAHKHLNGKMFFYSQPPVVDPATGRRRLPGADYQCRCVDIPVLDAVGE